jgi:4-hydroxybenzoate polyprenyltransferase
VIANPDWSHDRDSLRRPLCVDLDGTLLSTDLLLETFVRYVKPNPLRIFRVIAWALQGRARLKARLAEAVDLDVQTLPVNEPFLEWLQGEKRAGRRLLLCTAANDRIARRVAQRFGLFDEILASGEGTNLSGRAKAQQLVSRFGVAGFDYAANERKDLHVWRQAHAAVVVAPPALARHVAAQSILVARSFAVARGGTELLKTWLSALRLHQWTKNLLLFVPLIAAHRVTDAAAFSTCLIGVILFGMCASGGYIVNDLLDLDADRSHPRKRLRPFAAGRLSILHGLLAAAGLVLGAMLIAVWLLPPLFAPALAVYLATSLWYSIALKRIAMVDVLALAGLYSVRIIAGGVAVAIVPSFWLLAFSMFLFLSLAAAKRYAELHAANHAGRNDAPGRGYTTADLPLLQSSGLASGYLSVLVLALYVNSSAAEMYSRPQVMWLLCPVLLYWMNRVWLKTTRGQMHHDPVVFALTDRPSWITFAAGAVLAWLAV